MALFSNPINTSAAAPSAGRSLVPSNSVTGDLVGAAVTGLSIWNQVDQRNDRLNASKAQAEAVTAASDISITRMQEFTELRDQKGQVRAMQYLRENYLEDLKSIKDPTSRKAYIDSFKGVFGGSPMDIENDAQQSLAEAEMKRSQELVDQGTELALASGMNPENYNPQQLARMAESFAGQGQVIARQASEVSLAIQQGTLQQSETKRNTNVAMRAFGAEFDAVANSRITGLHNVLKSRKYVTQNENGEQVTLSGDEAIQAAQNDAIAYITEQKAGLKQRMRNEIRQAGGDPTLISEADYNRYLDTVDTLQDLVTGENLGKISQTQLDTVMSQASLDAMKTMPKFAQKAAISKMTGAQVTIAPTAGQIAADSGDQLFSPVTSNPISEVYRRIRETVRSGAAESAVDTDDPNRFIKDNMDTVTKTMDNINYDNEEDVQNTGRMVVANLLNGTSNDPSVSNLANGKNGLITLHRKLAESSEQATKLAPAITAEAERRGMSVDDLYRGQIRNFYTRTLIPSLGLEGFREEGDVTASDMVTASNQGGKIKFEIDRSFFNPNTPAVQAFQTGQRVTKLQNFNNRLKKAETDLNTILKSYSNVSGANTDSLVQDIIDAYQWGVVEEGNAE